jgi:amino acid adenylation domain-containing protein
VPDDELRLDARHSCGLIDHVAWSKDDCERTATSAFAASVALHARCVAISAGGEWTTYEELARRADDVTRMLLAVGIAPGEPVPLLLDMGRDAVVAILGVLGAGGVFAPLDVLDPPTRTGALCSFVGARVVLTSAARRDQADAAASLAGGVVAVLVVGAPPPEGSSPRDAVAALSPSSPASIFFTSGSSGTPKAVLDNHRNILHNVLRYTNLLGLAPADRLSVIQRPSFSGIASSLFAALLNGATLCPFDLRPERVGLLPDWVEDERITVFHSVPAIFRALVRDGRTFGAVRVVRLEGDRATWREAAAFRAHFGPTAVLANGLGATETGLVCQLRLTRDAPLEAGVLPVGIAAPDVDALVVDDDLRPLPAGAIGELAIRSDYLALGYVEAPELTAKRFVSDSSGARLYLTRDSAVVDEAGRVVVLGRRDRSVKIGGARVEPAEIEGALLRLPDVVEAMVTAESGPRGDVLLTAIVVPARRGVSGHEIRRALGEQLPSYMIPARIDIVGALGVDGNWKIARRSGPERPPTERERALQRIWSTVLGVEVGLDDVFVELGGDSLAATEIAVAIEQELGLDVPVGVLARGPTVARLAAALETGEGVAGVEVVPLRPGGTGRPIVFLPDHAGNALSFAAVAAAIETEGPIWAVQLSFSEDESLEVGAVAARVAAALRGVFPDTEILLGGVCYGALLALETTRVLRAAGGDVAPFLFGLLPHDFPSLVPDDAIERWRRNAGLSRWSTGRVRLQLGRIRRRGPVGGAAYAGRLAARVLVRGVRRARSVPPRRDALQLAARGFRPDPLPGRATLLFSARTLAHYSDDPAGTWERLADEVEVRVLPGAHDEDVEFLSRRPGIDLLARSLSELALRPSRGAAGSP